MMPPDYTCRTCAGPLTSAVAKDRGTCTYCHMDAIEQRDREAAEQRQGDEP